MAAAMSDRRQAYRGHAQRRGKERYEGVTAEVILKIRRLIRRQLRLRSRKWTGGGYPHDPDCSYVRRTAQSRSLWNVTIDGQIYRIVFDDPTREVVTFLPIEVRE